VPNKCRENEISFRNRCGRLNDNTACGSDKNLKLQIDATSLEPKCAINFDSRFGENEEVETSTLVPKTEEGFCYPGSKRQQEGAC
jgi:hypothetical protein